MMANQISQEQVQTREELKKKKSEAKRKKREQKIEKQSMKRVRIRLIPIWLRIILFVILLAASLAGGLLVGYGVIGDGKPTDVFQKETWTHIIDLVKKGK
ncbi:DNA-directed RNA polymerase subunit beta [Bacillus niameyensis]|uniref:DNA-directed RNA polymerase subunit beta n=1 Tax=Bacillus niameyensis TaxID=1522308 RepID=UPI0007851E33|nr:DNA-directed RNA polymerase subunit beta [Bacillus niameyensis]